MWVIREALDVVTGAYSLTNELGTKQLGLLRQLVPAATVIALLANPNTPGADPLSKDLQIAVRSLGLQLRVLSAGTDRELDAVFASLAQQRPDALLVQSDAFMTHRRIQILAAAARHAIPTIFFTRDWAMAGGLMSYGASVTEGPHQGGPLCRADSQRREAGRLAGRTVDQVRVRHQS